MGYIHRELQERLGLEFKTGRPSGVILAGIVGCGKTTLINETLRDVSSRYDIFKFTGDDISFRDAVLRDTKFINNFVRTQTQRDALVFVDEVQKSEMAFDALKMAFDESGISFIVSGSNPDYLYTQAEKRLQRRTSFIVLQPFSLPELLSNVGLTPPNPTATFREVLLMDNFNKARELVELNLKLSTEIQSIIETFLSFGGLPLAYLTEETGARLLEIQKVVERGFEGLSVDNETTADTIRIELARLHSQEFTYQNIFQKTGLRRRDRINETIDELINHGFLLKKKPVIFEDVHRSYLSVFSYVDPGIITYLTAQMSNEISRGSRIEGIIHARLDSIAKNYVPLKSSLSYFKLYALDSNGKIKYKPGEIDFVFGLGPRIVPIEVKAATHISRSDVTLLTEFVGEHRLPFGIVLYNGVPMAESETRIIYWPFWLV